MTFGFPLTPRSISNVDYIRFMKGKKVVRVARVAGGEVLALYPSRNPNLFYGEAFSHIDDKSPRSKIQKPKIKDRIFLALLEGKTIEEITRYYEPLADNYSFCGRGTRDRDMFKFLNTPTFDISEVQE